MKFNNHYQILKDNVRRIFPRAEAPDFPIMDYIQDRAWDEEFVENYEEIAEAYLPTGPSRETSVFRNLVDFWLHPDTYPGAPKTLNGAGPVRVADIGCGRGFVLSAFEGRKNFLTYGVDISLTNLLHNETRTSALLRSFGEDLPLPRDILDMVIMTDLIEHVRDPERLVWETARVMVPGGKLLVACPWEQDLSIYDRPEYKKKHGKFKFVHLHSIDKAFMKRTFHRFFQGSLVTRITVSVQDMEFAPYEIRMFIFTKR